MGFYPKWVCGECRYGGHLSFGNTAFAPEVCPKCGSGDTAIRGAGMSEPLPAIRTVLAAYRSTSARITEEQITAAWDEHLAVCELVADPERMASRFHEAYERLAPEFGYKTRDESAVSWEDVPEDNKQLMIAVATEVTAPWFSA